MLFVTRVPQFLDARLATYAKFELAYSTYSAAKLVK